MKPPTSEVTEENFKLVTTDVPPVKEGDVLIQALYLSVDPYMRGRMTAPDATTRLNQVHTCMLFFNFRRSKLEVSLQK